MYALVVVMDSKQNFECWRTLPSQNNDPDSFLDMISIRGCFQVKESYN